MDSSVIKDEKSRFHLNMTAELLEYVLFNPFLHCKCTSCSSVKACLLMLIHFQSNCVSL